jgi:hypothetical protein
MAGLFIERGDDGRIRVGPLDDDHEHWNDGFDQCGTCGHHMLPDDQQVGRDYAVEREDGWHIATWDGECFAVTSDWQSGDRWLPEMVRKFLVLPTSR